MDDFDNVMFKVIRSSENGEEYKYLNKGFVIVNRCGGNRRGKIEEE